MIGALSDFILKLWNRAFPAAADATPLADERFRSGALAIARLRTAESNLGETFATSLIAHPTAGAAATPANTVLFRRKQESLLQLSAVGALNADAASRAILADLNLTLAAAAPATTPEPMSIYVVETAKAALAAADSDVIAALLVSAEASPWLQPLYLSVLRIEATVALRRAGAADESIDLTDALADVLASPDAPAQEAAAAWITAFKPSPLALLEVIEPQLKTEESLSKPVRESLGEISVGWNPGEKADLLEAIAHDYVTASIDEALIESGGLTDAAPERAGALLVQLHEDAGNNTERERVLKLWELVDPQGERVQRDLADKVFIPMLDEGKQATRIALNHFRVVRHLPSNAVKDRVKAAIRGAVAEERDLAKLAERVLKQAEWVSAKRSWNPFKGKKP